ncbi:NAD(P)(+) transhydrogenase (Re/Si-specific) subunit beta [Actinophytocola algeriensis]|uniref:NAD(P) transhydrogenase subunit beta n=1 Tax=Actinophytocola algeriensis TaxID=1768010 RepID=A0A7W7VJ09_9PSEU|nr:NAD(P)(+) transhydrogenase (Re/Si-specific) subunit beta [Actinophytocola algeriensis]MBB4911595.1 NAD(P) transhydrogenase subunit beta [Actinophytocola algeriensis]MBE1473417.1 NAD(P) transhydrogenase subunit beta [Actinophytocola algeriensis]
MSENWTALLYLVAAVCFIFALKGLSSPSTARVGNLVGAAGALVAVLVVFAAERPDRLVWILVAIAVGGAIGTLAARRVAMTAMPQMVALFNGVGGAAGALVALLELAEGTSGDLAHLAVTAFTVLIGSITFSGSVLTFGKLQELVTGRPILFPGMRWVALATVAGTLAAGVWVAVDGEVLGAVLLAVLTLALGLLLVLPVGGADVPIVISLLNAFSGITVAASGYVLSNTLLIVAGTLVGASGTLLTKMMADAMGRSLVNILFGAFAGGSTLGSTTESDRPVRSAGPQDVAILLGYARKVIVAPGYGLAVAQAQHAMRDLTDELEKRGIEVTFAIHPVAGRMPGHMNVLLAEADVPYDKLKEMTEINPEFRTTDVALVVGANDVVNPAAHSAPGSPIYGMPILEVAHADAVVFLKRSMRPGFAGIENELLYDAKTTLLFGDAKESLSKLVAAVKAL